MAHAIEVAGLTKRFGAVLAVDNLSFTVDEGRVVGFLGPNGAGKTTTFRCLVGLAEPSSGAALIDGRRYRELARPRRQVGAVLESMGFHPGRSGRNHLRVLARSAGIDPAREQPLQDTWIRRPGLEEHGPWHLTCGVSERQRDDEQAGR